MTIKTLSQSLVAFSMIASAVSAGTLTVDTNASTIAEELLVGQDYNGTSVDINSTYTPSLNAGVNDGKLLIEFTNSRVQGPVADLHLYNYTQGIEVGTNPQLAGVNNQKLTFDINGSINDADKIAIANSDGDGNLSTHDTNATVILDFLQNNTTFGMQYTLLDNTDQVKDTSSVQTVATTTQEWEVTVSQVYNNQIDAAQQFKAFYGTPAPATDVATIRVKQNTVGVTSGALTLNEVIHADNNVSAFADSWERDTADTANNKAITLDSSLTSDVNVTYSATTDDNVTFTPDGTNEIKVSHFKVALAATQTGNNPNFTKTYVTATDDNFGKWTIYGYTAQIPNVISNDTFLTNFKFTNRSSLDTNIYFTLIDRDGTKVTLNSVDNPELADLKAGSTGWYTASDLVTLAASATPVETATSTAGFDGTQAFSVEVSIPTTPDYVYGFASLKNKVLGNFKDLPVYNSSKMSY